MRRRKMRRKQGRKRRKNSRKRTRDIKIPEKLEKIVVFSTFNQKVLRDFWVQGNTNDLNA